MKNLFTNNNFFDDNEKMRYFPVLTKDEFLESYSYLTEQEYESTRILKVLEENNFYYGEIEEQDGRFYIDLNQSTPEGEDWWVTIWFDGTNEDFCNAVYNESCNFDVNEEVAIFIEARGTNGVPDSISDLLADAEWKKSTLEQLADALLGREPETPENVIIKKLWRYCDIGNSGGFVIADTKGEAVEKLEQKFGEGSTKSGQIWAWKNDDYYDADNTDVLDTYSC